MLDADVSYESTLSERFDPCMRYDYETGLPCGSRIGKIRCFVNHFNIGLFCERNHQRPDWYSGNVYVYRDGERAPFETLKTSSKGTGGVAFESVGAP
jgi:hypothetical protein